MISINDLWTLLNFKKYFTGYKNTRRVPSETIGIMKKISDALKRSFSHNNYSASVVRKILLAIQRRALFTSSVANFDARLVTLNNIEKEKGNVKVPLRRIRIERNNVIHCVTRSIGSVTSKLPKTSLHYGATSLVHLPWVLLLHSRRRVPPSFRSRQFWRTINHPDARNTVV